jgi:diketogulonate reductase-like aldo/keto reductase
MVPEVGLGTWQYKGGVEPLRRAIELGANLIDTAEIYRTEGVVGEAIHGMRERVFVATKVSGDHLGYKQVLRAAEDSLNRLGIDHIDLYQVHWPDRRVPIAQTMRAMEELADAGKIRFIGVSNFSTRQIEEAQAALSRHRIVANQVEYSLLQRRIEPDIASFYVPNQITVIAYSPYAQGALFTEGSRALKALQTIGASYGKTPAQVALNWCLSRPNVITIPKSDRVDRVQEMCGGSGWTLSPGDIAALDREFAPTLREEIRSRIKILLRLQHQARRSIWPRRIARKP